MKVSKNESWHRRSDSNTSMNQTWLWMSQERVSVRVILLMAMDSTVLLLIWACVELICKQERRRNEILFILNLCYLMSLLFTMFCLNIALYLPPVNASCVAVVGMSYMAVLCTLSWSLLTALQRWLMSRNPRLGQNPPRRLAVGITMSYLMAGYGVPSIGLLTLGSHFYPNKYVSKLMCWLSTDAIWWLLVPVILLVGGSYSVAITAFGLYVTTPADVRCFLYTCFILNVLFAATMMMVQMDLAWPGVSKSYAIVGLILFHNILAWLHFTDVILQLCPCAHTPAVVAQSAHRHTTRPGQRPEDNTTFSGDLYEYHLQQQPADGAGAVDSVAAARTGLQWRTAVESGTENSTLLQQTPHSPAGQSPDEKSMCNCDDDMGACDEDVIHMELPREVRPGNCGGEDRQPWTDLS